MSNYPSTQFNIIDDSAIPQLPVAVDGTATFLYGITADKGKEDLMLLTSNVYEAMYGVPSFEKHGQPAIQAAITLNNGGNILVKRLVADDATLANVCVVAGVKEGTGTHKLNANDEPLYLHEGNEIAVKEGDTVPDGATPIMTKVAEVKYETITVTEEKTPDGVLSKLEGGITDEGGFKKFPLFTILDNGRGESIKKFRIVPDYGVGRSLDYAVYRLNVIENTTIEQFVFSMDPEKMRYEEGFSMDFVINGNSNQIGSKMSEKGINDFVAELERITELEGLIDSDFLFGTDNMSKPIQEIKILDDSVNLSDQFGLQLESGTNGALGDSPIKKPVELAALQAQFFSGELDDVIYDKEMYPIHAIIDANYDISVKNEIEKFVKWRQDVFYFADMGTDKFVMKQFENRMKAVAKIREAGHYGISYDVYDEYSGKQITVTVGHALSKILPTHLRFNIGVPLAGINNAVIRDAIKNTVNFLPKHTPKVNQREALNDIRCNYATYLGDVLSIQTLYTANDKHTQLSYINNVLLVQDLMRAIIRKCPASRYSFISTEDLEDYQSDILNVIKRYEGLFNTVEFRYTKDPTMEQNKIYYASIFVSFKDFAQQERFDIHAINADNIRV